MAGSRVLSVDPLGTVMPEAAAVPLRAVPELQHEFIQAQAAMTQQSFAVQQRARSQRTPEGPMRASESIEP